MQTPLASRPSRRGLRRGSRFGSRLAIVIASLALAGCGLAGGSGSPASSPGASPGIAHPSGSTDVILRFDESGGFVAPGFFATRAPIFSLYGDGTAIFHDPMGPAPSPQGEVIRGVPYQTIRLTGAQVQALLAFAIGPGGLRTAANHYDQPIADAPTALLTIHTGLVAKTVAVNGLGIDLGQVGPNAAILAQLETLAARLQGFGSEAAGAVPWIPDRYRGILTEDSVGTPIAWPWPSIKPSDFAQRTAADAPPFPIRTMTPGEVATLGFTGFEAGLQGITLLVPSGKLYNFRLRPLLPDEAY